MKYAYATLVASLFLFIFLFNIADCSHSKKEGQTNTDPAYKADLIIFSYDRPLQLYALLESVQKYMTGLGSIVVLYRVSSQDYADAYKQVFADFPEVSAAQQGDNPASDFKPLSLLSFILGPSSYVLFAVDDIVVTDYISISDCARAMKEAQAYGFYLRLGVNLDYCYSLGRSQPVPELVVWRPHAISHIISNTQPADISNPELGDMPLEAASDNGIRENDLCCWRFAQGHHDWNYPHTVDMTLYRKKDILMDMYEMNYSSPNTFEAQWDMRAVAVRGKRGICFGQSKIVNLPLNRVQHDYANRAMEGLSSAELLSIFTQNKKMAIEPLYRIKNKSAHMEYVPEFVAR